jgi:hypothetical protein
MSRFYVGQRVKVVRSTEGCRGRGERPHIVANGVGRTGVIAGTMSHPNVGFHPHGDYDVSIRLDTGELGMCPSVCLEPITDSYDKVEWSECLWRPQHEEQAA